MSSPYTNYLHLKSTLKELPKTFYAKLNSSEKAIFDELLNTIESTLPSSQNSKKSQKTAVIGDFQPRIVIFCLNLKKAIVNRHYRLKRFTFGLIRCLYKEEIRLSQLTFPKIKVRKIEARSKDLGTSTDDIEESILRVRAENEIKKKKVLNQVTKLMTLKNDRAFRNSLFVQWQKALSQAIQRKKVFCKHMSFVISKHISRMFVVLVKNLKNMNKPIGYLLLSVKGPMKTRLLSCFFSLVTFNHPNLIQFLKNEPTLSKTVRNSNSFSIDLGEFIPGLNYKEFALTEAPKNVSLSLKKNPKALSKPSQSIEDENFEDFSTGPKKSTKMVKKKQQLLRRANDVEKINKIASNHRWVEAFALLKWKKVYFSVRTKHQSKKDLSAMVAQLLEKIVQKLELKPKSFVFETLKIKNDLSNQSKNFKISLAISMVANVIKQRRKMIYCQFLTRIAEQSVMMAQGSPPVISRNSGRSENLESRTFHFYKKFKEVIKKIQLKKKIIGFVSIQNFYDTRIDQSVKIKLTSLFLLIQRIKFSTLFNTFHEIKEKSVAFIIRSQAFYFIFQSLFQQKIFEAQKSAFNMIKAEKLGRVNYFVDFINKSVKKSLLKSTFLKIKDYSESSKLFFSMRAAVFASLSEKIYFKKISNALIKWENSVEDYFLELELGLRDHSEGEKREKKFEFEGFNRSHAYSQDINKEINYFVVGHSRFFSELVAK